MISLLATTTCNNIENYKKFNSSINFPIETLSVLVNNQDINYFDQVRQVTPNPLVKKYEYSYCPRNMGCPSSWNYHIKHYPKEKYWIQSSDDVMFQSTELLNLYNLMEEGYDGVFAERCNYVLFGLSRNMIKTIGFFDENFHPACFEDNDYRDRINVFLGGSIGSDRHIRSENSILKVTEFSANFIHNGSQAGYGGGGTGVNFTPELLESWNVCYANNQRYYNQKWESQISQNIPLWYWKFDIDRRAHQQFII